MADKVRVLVVEDDLIVARSIENHLQNLGYQVLATTPFGEEAVTLAETLRPDLILMDIKLQGELDGIGAAQQIRAFLDAPVVYLTAYADPETLAEAMATAPAGYLVKPFGLKDLYSTLQVALYKHRMEQQVAHLNRVLRAIRNVNQLITREKDPALLLQGACDCLIETQGYTSAWIVTFTAAGAVALRAQAGAPAAFAAVTACLQRAEWPPCWRKLQAQPDPILRIEAALGLCESCALGEGSLPQPQLIGRLQHGAEIYGLMGLAFPPGASVEDEAIDLFKEVLGDIAFALYSIGLEKQREQAEAALRESRLHYRLLSELTTDFAFAFRLDPAGAVILDWVTGAFTRITGYSPDELAALPDWQRLIHPDDWPAFLARMQNILVGAAETAEVRIINRRGELRWLRLYGRRVMDELQSQAVRVIEAAQDITEQKRIEGALRQERDRAQQYLDLAGVMFVALDTEGRIVLLNQRGGAILGYAPEALIGADWFAFAVPEAARATVRDVFRQLIAGEMAPVEYYENSVVTQAGVERIIAWHNALLRDAAGVVIGTLSSGEDITERKQAAAALAQSESMLRSIFRAAPIGIGLVVNRVLQWVNETLQAMVGYTADELLGQSARLLYASQEEFERVGREKYARIRQYGTGSIETQFRCKDGRILDILLSSTPLNLDDWSEGVTFTALDITERKQAEHARRESEEKYRRIIETANEGVWMMDAEYRTIFVNTKMAEMLGYTPAEMAGQRVDSFMVQAELADHRAQMAARQRGESTRYERRFQHRDGSVRWLEVSATALQDAAGAFSGSFAMFTDVTHRKQAEAERDLLLSAERTQRELAETLFDIALALNSNLDREALLYRILEQLARVVAYDRAAVTLATAKGCEIVAYRGFDGPPTPVPDMGELPHVRAVLDQRRVVILPDTWQDPRWQRRPVSACVRSWMGVPVVAQERVLGLLSLDKCEPGFYTPAFAELALAFANQAALAIENARLYAQALRDAQVKDTLLQEIHHRVKNNLHVISSLLELQADSVTDPAALAALGDSCHRIKTIALVHDKLYQSPDLSCVYMADYISSEVFYLFSVHRHSNCDITPHLQVADLTLDISLAMPCGLIVNELVSNALKHAFPPEMGCETGEIHVEFYADPPGHFTLIVRDNGVGLPPDFEQVEHKSLGLQLLKLLTAQLEGTLEISGTAGATFRLTFDA